MITMTSLVYFAKRLNSDFPTAASAALVDHYQQTNKPKYTILEDYRIIKEAYIFQSAQ